MKDNYENERGFRSKYDRVYPGWQPPVSATYPAFPTGFPVPWKGGVKIRKRFEGGRDGDIYLVE